MWVSVCVCVYCNLTWHRFLSLIFLEKNMNFNYHDRKSELMYTETQCILDSYVITSSIQAISLSFWCQAGQRLIEFCQENVLVITNTLFQQHKTLYMDITRWSTPKSDWLYSLQPKMEKLYTVSKNKTRSWPWLRSWTPYCQIQTKIEESRENH